MDELLSFLENGTEREKQLALSMFVTLRSELKSDTRFSSQTRERLKHLLLQHVRRYYPLDPSTASTFLVLVFLDPQSAGQFLATELKFNDNWPRPVLDRVFRDMLTSGSESLSRLRQISRHAGSVGEQAESYLEMGGHITPARLEELGAEFRKKHTVRALNRIYSSYILHCNQQPIAPILKLLGKPTKKLKGAYIYETEGIQLYMEEDQQGRLTAAKMK